MTASYSTPSELRRLRKGCDANGEKGWKCDAQISKVNVLDLMRHPVLASLLHRIFNSESSRSHHHASNQHQAWSCGLEGAKQSPMQLGMGRFKTASGGISSITGTRTGERRNSTAVVIAQSLSHSHLQSNLKITSSLNTFSIVSLRWRPCSTTFLNSSSRFIVDDYLNQKKHAANWLQENYSNQNGWFWWSSIQLNQVCNQHSSQTEIWAGLVPITAPKPLPKALPRYPYLPNGEKNCRREKQKPLEKSPWLRAGLCSRQKAASVQQASLLTNAMLDLRNVFLNKTCLSTSGEGCLSPLRAELPRCQIQLWKEGIELLSQTPLAEGLHERSHCSILLNGSCLPVYLLLGELPMRMFNTCECFNCLGLVKHWSEVQIKDLRRQAGTSTKCCMTFVPARDRLVRTVQMRSYPFDETHSLKSANTSSCLMPQYYSYHFVSPILKVC